MQIARDGEEALQKLQEEPFDLIVMDLIMPRMNGVTALENIEKMGLHIPCIVLTGYISVQMTKQALNFGACDFLEKPCEVDELEKKIEKVLQKGEEVRVNKAWQKLEDTPGASNLLPN